MRDLHGKRIEVADFSSELSAKTMYDIPRCDYDLQRRMQNRSRARETVEYLR